MDYYGLKNKPFNNQKTRLVLSIFIVLNIFIYSLLFSENCLGLISNNYSKQLRIDFVNVGQGDCCVVRTPKGRTFVIDGGTEVTPKEAKETGRELIYQYLNKLNVKKIDGIVATHWHVDDFSGLIPLLKNYKVDCVYETPVILKNEFYNHFDEACKNKNIKRITVRAGNVLEWGDDIFVQVLNPEDYLSDYNSANNNSIVLLIRYGKVQVLLCADIQDEAERDVIKYNEGLKSQVIKIPDHGAARSSYKPFFKMVAPSHGVISVGKDNQFGYPSDQALELFDDLGIKIYRTDINGNIRLTVGGKDEKDYYFSVDR